MEYIIEDVDLRDLNDLKNSLNKFNPEVIILTNNYFDQYPINNNNLIVIEKPKIGGESGIRTHERVTP